ncbi:hypothetical protein HUT08_36155 [Streptomyces buecherae]|uniref:Uncharacterized protein n=1 Tax=Streptomyces buecherae TaxID=2763006 RepID=A0A7H8N120_9ACTN|nr:hypothetical protein HUT08_00270 [Streptomyces buecherae]QKW48196.1 hypothetical protein HUT08_36155 [Streptomyces buecherae]
MGVLAGLEEDRHDDPGDPRAAVAVGPECAADVLDDLDLGAAGVGEADGLDSPFAGDVDAFPEDVHRGEEGPVHAPVSGVDSVGELVQDFTSLGDEVVAAQPCRPHAVRGYVAAGLQLVELCVARTPSAPATGGLPYTSTRGSLNASDVEAHHTLNQPPRQPHTTASATINPPSFT